MADDEVDLTQEPWLPASVVLWPDAKRGPWLVILSWRFIAGRVECVGMEIRCFATPDEAELSPQLARIARSRPRQLTASDLRRLPFGQLVEETRGQAGDIAAAFATVHPEWQSQAEAWQGTRRTGRKSAPPDRYVEVARIYSDAARVSSKPTQAVAKALHVTPSAAAKLVARARERGLLPATTRGRARAVEPAKRARGRTAP